MTKKESAATGFFWRFLERCGAQGVTFIVSIVLARILDPEVYGTVALVTVFSAILQTFVDGGLGTALIQKKDADDIDFSTVFYFNFFMCIILYALMFVLAKPIALFYNRIELVPLIRVLSLTLVISGVKNIQQAYVSRHMIFKKFFFATLSGTIIAAVVGIFMAYKGFGVWALVAQNLINKVIDTIILWITVKWRPKKYFSFERLKGLWSFGWKLLIVTLIDRVYKNIRALIIGKKYAAEDLAYYNKGDQYPGLVVDNIDVSIDSVLLPTMSSVQDKKDTLKRITRRSLSIGSYILIPILMGLAVCAKPIVSLMLTDKWLPCVPYLRVFCFSYALRPLNTANINAMKAMGRSDLVLKLDIAKKCIGLLLILTTVYISVFAMAVGMAISSFVAMILNIQPNKKLLGYTFREQMADLLPSVGISFIMGALVYSITFLKLTNVVTLLIQIPIGILSYVILSKIFKLEGYTYVLNKIKPVISKIKKKGN